MPLLLVVERGAARADPITVRDAAGQSVTIRDTSRIVSIGGAITEILYALGLEQRVVAIDSTSFYPPQALREKPNVGYMRALSPEGVLGLNPSLILATEDAGPKEAIAVLRAAGIPFVLGAGQVQRQGHRREDRDRRHRRRRRRARRLSREGSRRPISRRSRRLRSRVDQPLKATFLLSFVNNRAMVAGRDTAADGIIKLAGATNAIAELRRLQADQRRGHRSRRRPDFVLAMRRDSHPLDARDRVRPSGLCADAGREAKSLRRR